MSEQQQIYDSGAIRILITAADDYGRLRTFAERSSRLLFEERPPGWRRSRLLHVTDPETGDRDVRMYTKQGAQIVAVPHEWGLELVLATASGVASTALVGFVSHLWRTWREQKVSPKREQTVLRVQRTVGRGRKKVTETVELAGDLTPEQIRAIVAPEASD